MNNELYHYGVKGMKWGVRRAKRAKSVYLHKADKQVKINIKLVGAADKILKTNKTGDGRILTAADRKNVQRERDMYEKAAKNWIATRNDIMNMNISDLSSKDIKKRFNNAKSSRLGAYVY